MGLQQAYAFTFASVAIFLVVEAVYNILGEVRNESKTSLSQATVWVRSLLMIVMAMALMYFTYGTYTSIEVVQVPY